MPFSVFARIHMVLCVYSCVAFEREGAENEANDVVFSQAHGLGLNGHV